MKKFIAGLVIGTVAGMCLEAWGLARCVVEDGVDLNAIVWNNYDKAAAEPKISSWRRKYSTPQRKR